jgi:hypothetical protein
MFKHPYLRAYLAGIAFPTVFILIGMTAFTIARYIYNVPVHIERFIVFPMAAVPTVWGLWNILYRALDARRYVSLGVFGGALPLILAPCGYLILRTLDITFLHEVFGVAAFALPVGLIIYYLLWKHVVGFLNAELGIG